jgi:hypothetical protein
MKAIRTNRKTLSGLFVTLLVGLFIPQTALCQAEKLGVVSYTPPQGWAKTAKENIVAFSQVNQPAGTFCIITLYGATPGTGSPEGDFKREWDKLVVKTLNAEPNPKTETETDEGWTATAGGAVVDFQGGKSLAALTVISGGGVTVSILAVFNDESYAAQLAAFNSSVEMEKALAEAPATSPDILVMHAAALVKEFENNEIRANQMYVGKRLRVHGIVNTIEIARDGQIVLTYKSSITTRNNARCYFGKSQGSRVASLTANEEGTVEGTVRGLGDGFEGAKAFLVLKDCVVP